MKDGFGRGSLKSLSTHHFVLARDPFLTPNKEKSFRTSSAATCDGLF